MYCCFMLKRPKHFLVFDLQSLIYLKWKDLRNQVVALNTFFWKHFSLFFLIAFIPPCIELIVLSLGSISILNIILIVFSEKSTNVSFSKFSLIVSFASSLDKMKTMFYPTQARASWWIVQNNSQLHSPLQIWGATVLLWFLTPSCKNKFCFLFLSQTRWVVVNNIYDPINFKNLLQFRIKYCQTNINR